MNKATLALIPGFLCDEQVWQDQQQALANEFNIIIPRYQSARSFHAMAEQVLSQIEGDFIVAGHSMGGKIAMVMASMAPERIQHMILMSTSVDPLQQGEPDKWQRLLDVAHQQGMPALADELIHIMLHPDHYLNKELVTRIRQMIASHSINELESQAQAALQRPDLAGIFSAITEDIAVHILCGDQDGWVSLEQQRVMQNLLPHAELTIFPRTGHLLTLEKPTETSLFLKKYLLGS